MDQLKGKVVNVVLTIQEGKGMDSIKNLAFISANFNGRVLESDPVNAEDCPSFNTNLIWEIEKKDLRKIRSSNQPLRVECLSIDNQNRREKFGYVLLDLRGAQIVDDSSQVPFRWHKLIGVRNKRRNCLPELYVSLTIRSHLEIQHQESIEDVCQPEPRVEGSLPIKYLEDGYIMVGEPEKGTEDYSLNILIKSAANLDLLLPEVLVFQNNNKYCMCIKIFGIPIKTKQFSKDLHDRIVFEEKIVVRLLSNFDTLTQFFAEEQFEVGFNCGNDLLGVTTISFDGLINLNEKLSLGACFFRFPSPNGIVPVSSDSRKPSLALELALIKNHEDIKNDYTSLVSNIIPDVSKASGDHSEESKEDKLLLVTEDQVKEFEEWKERQRTEFEEQLEEEMKKERDEIDQKKAELDENITKCKELQVELQEKLDELKLTKALKKKRKSSSTLFNITAENQKKFADCDKELLIDYISTLQNDNENLKQIITEQQQELDGIQKTALTKEQTTNLLQELKGLEEKFEVAQQTKTYFKEQWKKACLEIHNLKTEDYKQLQDQLRERREELNQLDHLCVKDEPNELVSY